MGGATSHCKRLPGVAVGAGGGGCAAAGGGDVSDAGSVSSPPSSQAMAIRSSSEARPHRRATARYLSIFHSNPPFIRVSHYLRSNTITSVTAPILAQGQRNCQTVNLWLRSTRPLSSQRRSGTRGKGRDSRPTARTRSHRADTSPSSLPRPARLEYGDARQPP